MHWIYLLIAAICEICWFYCIKQLNNLSLAALLDLSFLLQEDSLLNVAAIVGYAGFGAVNILFFSMAMKRIPSSTAFGVWTGLALCGTTLVDAFYLDVDFTKEQGVFMILICAGIVGLKVTTASNPPSE